MSHGPGDLLAQFEAAISLRRQRETQMAELVNRKDPQLAALQEQLAETERRHSADLATTESQRAGALDALTAEHQTEQTQAQRDRDSTLREIVRSHDAEAAALERQHNDSTWVVSSVMADDSDDSPRRQHERVVHAIERTKEDQTTAIAGIANVFESTAAERKYRSRDYEADVTAAKSLEEVQEQFQATINETTDHVNELGRLKLPKLFLSWRPAVAFLLLVAAATAVVYFAVDPSVANITAGRSSGEWVMLSLLGGALAAVVVMLVLYVIAMSGQNAIFRRWEQELANARVIHERWMQLAQKDLAAREPVMLREQARVDAKREETLERNRTTYEARIADIRARKEAGLAATQQAYRQRATAADQLRAARLADLTRWHTSTLETIESNYHSATDALKAQVAEQMAQRQREQSAAWSQLKLGWEKSLGDFQGALEASESQSQQAFPAWSELAGRDIARPKTIPSGIPLGRYGINLNEWPNAISNDARLAPRRSELTIPAHLKFPERPSLLLKSRSPEGRAAALPILQTAMLRLLTALPPGTLRFTLIDPVGLGDSFAGFMHLADVDEMLVTSRIWTEPNQIEARLADLTEHMENVLQTYLRNEFPTLEDYNRHAGEVAEPYRIVVIRDFPAKFSEIAARRLTSIITSGPRCGVYVLMSVDGKLQVPNNFHLGDIEPSMNVFEWNDPPSKRTGRFDWVHDAADPLALESLPAATEEPVVDSRTPSFYSVDPALSRWPLIAEAAPGPELFSQIVKSAGAAAKGARRVEVSFERIAPAERERWSLDSRKGIDIPMGRAGAVKLQHVRLGQGTSQHMLIAGKTGSGKSTFLHGLITNLALHYSPDELQFFLIDFKKGVEFKDYAQFHLPHARVIAIESDREFGVSALTRLDELMAERGDLFRKHGAQDVTGFRNGNPNIPMPRVLLVIDEFQEFFTEDDRHAQTAALLLDRLVRQGRAFGIHVILGSQTLGGAYTLARSTLGQVAVRVALQCSEADAHLILSEDNTAARLLSRPGEAIYNDANGLVEGNHPFQIAWLPDDKREQYLRDLEQMADARGLGVESPIIFEGNIPSDLSQNRVLRQMATTGEVEPRRRTAPRIWLGDAVEIGEPTSIVLERQSSANVLLVGQDAEAVQGILAAAAIALATQSADGDEPAITLFDGSAADDPVREVWSQLEQMLGSKFRRVAPSQAAGALSSLTAERERRDADRDTLFPTSCVFVYNLSRFRDLRRAEDDFGFGGGFGGSGEQTVSPAKQFSQLLTGGPELGLHCVIWADSYNNVERWFSRQMLRDFELRILFPMNAADSSNLIDSPLASRLGTGRAILYREDRGAAEKFRPYAAPGADWMSGSSSGREVEETPGGEEGHETALSLDEFSVS